MIQQSAHSAVPALDFSVVQDEDIAPPLASNVLSPMAFDLALDADELKEYSELTDGLLHSSLDSGFLSTGGLGLSGHQTPEIGRAHV